jgi:hypothetical protein
MIKLQRFVSVVLSGLFAILSFPIAAEAETCKDWLAKAVSVQGSVHARVKNQNQWVPVQMNNTEKSKSVGARTDEQYIL